MKIFISWSGARSKAIAEILSDWVKCVLQATRPWLSTRDIDRGALWFSEIHDQLKDTSVGIVCLTQENKIRPWILFEAGALAKGLSSSRVCTFLIDLKPSDLQDPLAQFNHTLPERQSMWELIRTLNGCLGANSLDERILIQVFDTYWGQFEDKFKASLKEHLLVEKAEPRPKEDVLSEILENTRYLQHRLRRLEISNNLDDRSHSEDLNGIVSQLGRDKISQMISQLMNMGLEADAICDRLKGFGVSRDIVFRQYVRDKRLPGYRDVEKNKNG
jgi:hypothetical protein